jgi:hypothetical protein
MNVALASKMDRFVWQPGFGIDSDALARLRAYFQRPAESMGEGWFMGESRRIFLSSAATSISSQLGLSNLPLQEIASGTSAFGPLDEWNLWYHYLLGQLLPRAHEAFLSSLLESLITGFMALHPNGVYAAPYPQFLDDTLLTLGGCMMERSCHR